MSNEGSAFFWLQAKLNIQKKKNDENKIKENYLVLLPYATLF